jgi:hypothetical protein
MKEAKSRYQAWRENNRDKYRAQSRRAMKKVRMLALLKVGNKCAVCGCDDVELLEINHVNGGGKKEVREMFGGIVASFYRAILNGERSTKGLNVLCVLHNQLDRVERIKPGTETKYRISWVG